MRQQRAMLQCSIVRCGLVVAMLAFFADVADADRDAQKKKEQKCNKLQDRQRVLEQKHDVSNVTDDPSATENKENEGSGNVDFQNALTNANEVAESVGLLKQKTQETSDKAKEVSSKFESYGTAVKALETNLDKLTEEQHTYNVAVANHIKEGEKERMKPFNEDNGAGETEQTEEEEEEKSY
eukprot:CAMPEP_0172712482 /NCGR_PEP_ID=MMETSP1074-20121228/61125_1 /TAXON_ID=2916 /ORGANISM="Ceratium fusus, Strain PA161109" /LENGTH=181 /DNA_ID=CAMNT_0013536415 /DNA_START=115 /DNA_END=660 /DNA_ORIENTATION=+